MHAERYGLRAARPDETDAILRIEDDAGRLYGSIGLPEDLPGMPRGLPAVTLTTFADVPWNAPLYRRWGFCDVPREAMPTWLKAIRDDEDAGVLRSWPRVAMQLDVTGGPA